MEYNNFLRVTKKHNGIVTFYEQNIDEATYKKKSCQEVDKNTLPFDLKVCFLDEETDIHYEIEVSRYMWRNNEPYRYVTFALDANVYELIIGENENGNISFCALEISPCEEVVGKCFDVGNRNKYCELYANSIICKFED